MDTVVACCLHSWLVAELDLDADGDEEDGVEGEEEEGVDEDGGDAGLEVAQGEEARLGGHLEDEPRRQQDEEHERDEHRRPVLHLLPSPIPAGLADLLQPSSSFPSAYGWLTRSL